MRRTRQDDQFVNAARLHAGGLLREAGEGYRAVLRRDARHAASLHGLGVIACQSGDPERGLELISRAISLEPGVAAYQSNLGNALKALGRADEAAVAYRRALAIEPRDAAALNNLGNLLSAEGRLDEAIDSYKRALAVRGDDAVALTNLGNALAALGRRAEARTTDWRALELRPTHAEARYNLGNLLADLGELDAAEAEYRKAIASRPDHLSARLNLGGVLRLLGRFADAAALYKELIAEAPGLAEAHSNLGRVFMAQGRLREAEDCYERALAINPNYRAGLVNRLIWLQYSDRDPQAIFNLHRQWGELVEDGHPPAHTHLNRLDPRRRLRVGYFSSDFRAHSSRWFLAPLLAGHDREAVEVFCYADVAAPDHVTRRFQSLADHWRVTAGMPDEKLAELIRGDGVDILVDTVGHLAGGRLPMFARRAAPVQVNWLGYLNTTGLRSMDYRIVDDITDPPGVADAFATETLVRLPCGWLCYEASISAPPPGPPPSSATGRVTFGAFSGPAKLSDGVLGAWGEILSRTPGSRLLLKGASFDDPETRELLLARLAARGVDGDRVEMRGWAPSTQEHLRLYNSVDVVLDTFPHNGVTTTCEALWMGCPVVAVLGDRHCARISASFLARVGLTDLIAADSSEYVDIATRLAGDQERLSELRRNLRARMAASPLCDAKGFAREMEAAFRTMWRVWCERAGG